MSMDNRLANRCRDRRLPAMAVLLSIYWGFLLLAAASTAHGEQPHASVDYARDIRPLFAKHCFVCHGLQEEEGGLRLDDMARAKAGGVSGPVIIAGDAAGSLLWQFVTGRNEDKVLMPPPGRGARLSEAQCELIRRWIDAGASFAGQTSMPSRTNNVAPPPCVECPSKNRAPRRSRWRR